MKQWDWRSTPIQDATDAVDAYFATHRNTLTLPRMMRRDGDVPAVWRFPIMPPNSLTFTAPGSVIPSLTGRFRTAQCRTGRREDMIVEMARDVARQRVDMELIAMGVTI